MSGEEGRHDDRIDDPVSDDCNVAMTCAADNESDILRFSPMRNYNLHKLQGNFSEGP
jgi:hypothetical protein